MSFYIVNVGLTLASFHKSIFFVCIRPPLGLLPVLGPLEQYMTPTLDGALLCSSRAGSDLGRTSDWLRSFVNWVSSFHSRASMLLRGERESFACLDMVIEPLLYISDTHLGRVISDKQWVC